MSNMFNTNIDPSRKYACINTFYKRVYVQCSKQNKHFRPTTDNEAIKAKIS